MKRKSYGIFGLFLKNVCSCLAIKESSKRIKNPQSFTNSLKKCIFALEVYLSMFWNVKKTFNWLLAGINDRGQKAVNISSTTIWKKKLRIQNVFNIQQLKTRHLNFKLDKKSAERKTHRWRCLTSLLRRDFEKNAVKLSFEMSSRWN